MLTLPSDVKVLFKDDNEVLSGVFKDTQAMYLVFFTNTIIRIPHADVPKVIGTLLPHTMQNGKSDVKTN